MNIQHINVEHIQTSEFDIYPGLDAIFNGTIQRCLSQDRIIEIRPDPLDGFFSLFIYHLKGEWTSFSTKEPIPRGLVELFLEQELKIEKPDIASLNWHSYELREDVYQSMPSVVYFIRVGRFVKIGTTTNISARLNSFQIGCPYEFTVLATLPGGRKEEMEFHRKFSHLSHLGEWFRFEGDLEAFLSEVTK